jgi:ribosome-associated protein
MIEISRTISIPDNEVDIEAVRSAGPGGQNVNKVSTAVHLRFDVGASSLPDTCKERLLALSDRRRTKDGVIVIKAQRHRTQDMNRADALERLQEIIARACKPVPVRKATKPSRASRRRRLEAKVMRAVTKKMRGKIAAE